MGSRAAFIAALLVCGGTAANAQIPIPPTGTLPGGVAYEIRPDAAQSAAAIALWYRAPSGGFDPSPTPGLSRLAATTVAASAPITGTPLGALVERFGGRLVVEAYPDSVAITALVPPDHVAATLRAMTGDYFAPVVTAAGLQAGLIDTSEDALFRSFDVDAIEDALGAALFAAGPFHDGTIGTQETLAGAKIDQVRAFAERAFRPANAILILTGNVDSSALASVASRVGPAGNSAPEAAAVQTPRPASPARQLDAHIGGTGLAWIGPPIADEAAATTMDFLADSLFAPKTGVVAKALGKSKATVTGKFVTYRDPGVFLVTISGDDAAAALPIVEQVIADAAKPPAAGAFASARASFVYHLLDEMDTPSEVADTYGWYAVEGNAAYAPAEGGMQGRYFRLVAALTPAAVARTAAKYLGTPPAVVTLKRVEPAGPKAGT